MSTIAAWTYNHQLSFWVVNLDAFGQPIGYEYQYTLMGSFEIGGDSRMDDTGIEFVPKSTFYFEYEGSNPPKRGWIVALSGQAGAPPTGAETIRSVTLWDIKMFGASEVPDMAAYTSNPT